MHKSNNVCYYHKTFRRATSIRDRIIQSEFKGSKRKDSCKYKGTFI